MNNHSKEREKENLEYRLIESNRYQIIVISNKQLKNNEILSGLEKSLNENKENNNEEKIISLESIINNEKYIGKIKYKKLDRLDNYTEKIQDKITLNLVLNAINSGIDPITRAIVRAVPSTYLPSGDGWKVLGMYDPSAHIIYIDESLPLHELVFVYAHEVAHAEGIRDEYVADLRAEQRTGYNLRNAA